MEIYHDGAAGVTVRRAGEPCDHRHRVSYTDEGGLYSRCAVCGDQLSPKPAEIDAERLVGAKLGTDRPATPPQRVYTDPDCDFCQQYRTGQFSMAPPHDASTRCKSGSRTHCSCDACF